MTNLDLTNTGILTAFSKESNIDGIEKYIKNQFKNCDAIDFIREYNHMNLWLGKNVISTPAMKDSTNKINALLIKKGLKPFVYHITIDGTRYDRSIYNK